MTEEGPASAVGQSERIGGYGMLNALLSVVRLKYSQITAECMRVPESEQDNGQPVTRLRVRYKLRGPWLIEWDGFEYVWIDGPRAGRALGDLSELDTAADEIAQVMGVVEQAQG
jgi:hypothetical protein